MSKGLGCLCQHLRGPESLQISKSLQSENLYSALQSPEHALMNLTFAAGLQSSPSTKVTQLNVSPNPIGSGREEKGLEGLGIHLGEHPAQALPLQPFSFL